jgi:hypothetical protein
MIAALLAALLVPALVPAQPSMAAAASAALAATAPLAPDVASLKPDITWRRIPYGDERRRQMAGYSKRHYGIRSWHLTRKLSVVQHYTTGTTWQGAWNTFAANTRHLGELPGTCTHFIVHTDGTIYQLVPLWIRCRHVIGMNQLSIGHAESLDSPLRRERYPEWRCMTHSDMARPAMRTYRGWLKDRARAADVPIGPRPQWVDIGC